MMGCMAASAAAEKTSPSMMSAGPVMPEWSALSWPLIAEITAAIVDKNLNASDTYKTIRAALEARNG